MPCTSCAMNGKGSSEKNSGGGFLGIHSKGINKDTASVILGGISAGTGSVSERLAKKKGGKGGDESAESGGAMGFLSSIPAPVLYGGVAVLGIGAIYAATR